MPADELFAALLHATDRDRLGEGREVVSLREQEDAGFVRAVREVERSRVELWRRGAWHGEWAEVRTGARAPQAADPAARWHAARPLVLRDAAAALLAELDAEIDLAPDLHRRLGERGGLRAWISEKRAGLEPGFRPLARRARLADPERDLERALFESLPPSGRGRKVDDLWIKTAWLSTHEGDDSLRLRVSFGSERADDASGDLLRHRLVADLASRLLPGIDLVEDNAPLRALVERLCGVPVLFTQAIAYWNAPEGGALFHHDAFALDEEDARAGRQLGVCYVQASGRTAWLALSIDDLARRTQEFLAALEEGELPWVRSQLFGRPEAWRRAGRLAADRAALLRELALPGCGALGPLVNRGPEFTSFLADAGHAVILDPGDVILLPNHGPLCTAMHSVFCAGEEVAYSLSLALRPDQEERLDRDALPDAGPAPA